MRQGDGSDLLGPGDPRNADIGILYVESNDSRQDILLAIHTQELQGRKQIAIVLPEQRKAFRQPVDFDGLKNMRRSLKAQLVFIAPPGPGPAEFARQRRFAVYSTLDSFKNALLNEDIPAPAGRTKSNPGIAPKPRLLGFGSRRAKANADRPQGTALSSSMPPTPPTPRLQGQDAPPNMPPTPPTPRLGSQDASQGAPSTPVLPPVPPTPRLRDQQVPPTPVSEMDTVEIDQSDKEKGKGRAGAAAAGAAAGMLAAGALANDDDALYAPPEPPAPQGNPISPIASGSATPEGPAPGPGRPKPPSKPLENRPAPGIIAFPSVPPATPTTGKVNAVKGQQRGSGKLPAAQGSSSRGTGKLPEQRGGGQVPLAQGPQGGPNAQNQPGDPGGRGNTGKVAAVAAGAALGAAALSGGPGGGVPVATAAGPNVPAPAAGGGGRAAIGQRPSGLTPLPPPYSRRSRRKTWRRVLLAVLIVLTLALIGSLYVGAHGGLGPLIPGNITATVTITPASKLEQNNYILEGLPTGTPDPAQRQIAARILKQSSPTQSGTGNASGSIPARQATGQLKFLNGNGKSVTIASVVLYGKSGVPISFNGPVTIPAAGTIVVTGFAVNPGSGGNIPAFDISESCCTGGVLVDNITAFTGGQNAQPNSVIQQSDIDNAAKPLINSLSQSTQSDLQKQVKSNERVVDGSFKCQPTVTADHKAGDVAKTVTVQVSVSCTEETYDFAAAQQMTMSLLRAKAQSDPALGPSYALDGQIVTSILSDTVVSAQGQVNIVAQAQGLWVYSFTDQAQQSIKQELVKRTKADALNVLQHQQGVASAKIDLSSGNVMPANASDITLKIVNLPGVQPTPTGSPTGATPVPTHSLTPTPTIGLGGS
jgi:hypothetical protein